MVSGEHSSPTMKQAVSPGVSDQSLSKTRISPNSRHNIRSKSGRSKRKNNNNNNNNIASLNHLQDHLTNSPYYKGLTDQSLAIPPTAPRLHPTNTTDHDHDHDLLSSSPYYKGLLAINITPHPFIPTNNSSFAYLPSPYYRGLLTDYDYTTTHLKLLFHGPPPPPPPPSPSFSLELMPQPPEEMMLDDIIIEQQDQKPLRERVSETTCDDHEMVSSEQDQYRWATKYQPMYLDDFICHRDEALQLKAKVKQGCGCSHFIFEGPPSVGKRSIIRAMLREVFGPDRLQITEVCRIFNIKGEMVDNIQVRLKKSLHHVEVNLSETKGYEKHVIADLFKETYDQLMNNSEPCFPENCKAIILYEAEKLSIESLLYIKWLLEKYKGCNKVFFCCSDESKLQPVKPLCITVRLSSPSTQELVQILEHIGNKEGIELSRDLVEEIILRSKNNLRQAVRSLEATCRNRDAVKDEDLILTGWEEDISNIAKNIIEEQSPRQLYVIRRKLQSLMIHDVSPDFIYKSLVPELTNLVDESLRPGVAKLDKEFIRPSEIKFETMKQFGHAQHKQAEFIEKNNDSTKQNRLTYLKVEEFTAKFMSWYKNSCGKGNKQ